MNNFVLKLYVTGQSARTDYAIANLDRLCKTHWGDDVELTIIDVLKYPNLAEEDKILATPTLVRESPLPRRCIIGDLSDAEKVLFLLGLHHPHADSTGEQP